jgi:tetratricopeptide (TPR) repeat protein
MGQALYVLSLTSYFQARPLEGLEQAREAVQALARTASREWLGLAYWILGLHQLLLGKFDDALDAEARVAEIAKAIGDARLESFAAFSAGWIHATLEHWDLAIEASRHGLEVARDAVSESGARSYLGFAHLGTGDVDTARPLLERALDDYERLGLRQPAARLMVFLGEAHLLTGAMARARELAEASIAIHREARHPWGIAYAERLLGRIAHAEGRAEHARQHLLEARATFTAVPCPFEAGRTCLDLAEVARACGDRQASVAHLAEARRLFTELGLARYIERADRLTRELGAATLPSQAV